MERESRPIDRNTRRQARRRARQRQVWGQRLLLAAVALLIAVGAAVLLTGGQEAPPEPDPIPSAPVHQPLPDPVEKEPEAPFRTTADTRTIPGDFPSQYAVVIDAQTGDILAQKGSDQPIYPASMTKVLTLLVAAEAIEDRTGSWTMTQEATDYCFVNECSVVGLHTGETVPVEELFYGCILCSGADACLGLADVAAGGHEAFVVLMNEKLEELGIADTAHFTNCVGIFDENHYCTVEDMALILRAALENDFCRQVLTTKISLSAPTPEHPEGQTLSNWFLRRIEEKDSGSITVRAGKTGYVSEAGFCAASYGEDESGRGYLCVTADSTSTKQAVVDHAELYRTYCA